MQVLPMSLINPDGTMCNTQGDPVGARYMCDIHNADRTQIQCNRIHERRGMGSNGAVEYKYYNNKNFYITVRQKKTTASP